MVMELNESDELETVDDFGASEPGFVRLTYLCLFSGMLMGISSISGLLFAGA